MLLAFSAVKNAVKNIMETLTFNDRMQLVALGRELAKWQGIIAAVLKKVSARERSVYVPDDSQAVETIKSMVALEFDIEPVWLAAKSREQRYAWPRQVAMALAREFTTHSQSEIGKCFGPRDHGTVLHAERVVADRCSVDVPMLARVTKLRAELKKVFSGKA